ncbi:MAG TPA: hypothetical protein VL501_05290 [Pyrinomonadaceae bacterium]|nr:hypothetical protein [Pyrinomonadaceae bacterium]
MKKLPPMLLVVIALAVSGLAQGPAFEVSKLPTSAATPDAFTQAGWKVEEVVKGDLNGDGKPDAAIKLAQIEASRESGIEGDRVLVIVFGDGGQWKLAAVGTKILQCVDCGGAFYGVMPAPANVNIVKGGQLIVENEHGSRDVSNSRFTFRYNAASGKFLLIGYDYTDNDRLTGAWTTESTNYSTNVRITKTGKGKRSTTKRTTIKPTKVYLEDANGDDIEYQALHRLGLD